LLSFFSSLPEHLLAELLSALSLRKVRFELYSLRRPKNRILNRFCYKIDKLVSYINHHHEKTNNDGVESENISKAFDAFLEAVIMCVKVPNPNGTHNNGH